MMINQKCKLNFGIVFVFIIIFSIFPKETWSNGDDVTTIELINGQHILNLPNRMKNLLKKFDPDFNIRQENDYPKRFLEQYQFASNQAPFAVIGDFNGDGILDVILDGDNKTIWRRLGILSKNDTFVIQAIHDNMERISHAIESYRKNRNTKRKDFEGLEVALFLISPGIKNSMLEDMPLDLKTDAFGVIWINRTSGIYYYKNGKFQSYILAD